MSTSGNAQTSRRRAPVVVAVFAALFLVVVAVAQFTSSRDRDDQPVSAATDQRSETTDPESAGSDGAGDLPDYRDSSFARRDPADGMAMGQIDAPVVMTVWTDFRCPFCAVFNRDTLPTLVADYVDTGKVRIEVRDVAFFGADSEAASVGGRAAAQQGRFFEYMSAVYAAAPEKGHPEMPRSTLEGFAREAQVPDLAAFTAALADPTLTAEAQQATAHAQQAGVTGVPFFVAGNQSLSGAQPESVFRQFLDTMVASAT